MSCEAEFWHLQSLHSQKAVKKARLAQIVLIIKDSSGDENYWFNESIAIGAEISEIKKQIKTCVERTGQ